MFRALQNPGLLAWISLSNFQNLSFISSKLFRKGPELNSQDLREGFSARSSGASPNCSRAHARHFFTLSSSSFACEGRSRASGLSSGRRGWWARTRAKVLARLWPLRSGKVPQYFSVRQGIFRGFRVIISRVNLVLGRAFTIVP